jgi:hypothetical protein
MVPPLAVGGTQTCRRADADRAVRAADQLTTWDAVSVARRHYAHCDDGSIAEGFSEAIARLLTDRWSALPELAQAMQKDPPLQAFVVRHLNSTLDTGDLESIARQAAQACPRGQAPLCRQLRAAANDALK